MRELQAKLADIHARMKVLVDYYNSEFNSKGTLRDGKLVLKMMTCGKEGCNYCPHGPYWYRAVLNKRAGRYMFQYLRKTIAKGMLKGYERQYWERIKFYDDEAARLRDMKTQVSREIKKYRKLLRH